MSNIDLMDVSAKEAYSATVKWAAEIVRIYAKSMSDVGITIGPEDNDFVIKEAVKAARILAEKITKDIEAKL